VTGLPIGVASLSAALKAQGFSVKIFDTCFYKELDRDQEELRAETQMTKPIVGGAEYWIDKPGPLLTDLDKLISEFKPSIVGVSVLENTLDLSLSMTRSVKKKHSDIITVAGGVFPTLTPEALIDEDSIDVICIGEGEVSFPNLCTKISQGEDYTDTDGFWIKRDGKLHKHKRPAKLADVNDIPHPDFGAFDEALLYKPMQGRLFKMLSIEASRGCAYRCPYCENSLLKDFYRNSGAGKYYRKLDMERVIDQIYYQAERHDFEFIYFASEYFLALSHREFDYFIKEYSKIKIPFYFQTRFETVKDDRLAALKEVGMFWMSVALEHGNEEFRKKHLKRNYSNEMVIKVVEMLMKHDVGASMQNMMGFPFEDRSLIMDTINLCKKIYRMHNKIQFNISILIPYRTCELYQTCKDAGLLGPEDDNYSNSVAAFDGDTPLLFPPEYKKELAGLWKTFNLYVKLPDEYQSQIAIAERDDEEGREMFEKLVKQVSWQDGIEQQVHTLATSRNLREKFKNLPEGPAFVGREFTGCPTVIDA